MSNKLLLVLLGILLSVTHSYAQLSKTIEVTTPGTLSVSLGDDKTKVTELILTGTINDVDFATIKQMTLLKVLDMGSVNIENGTIPAEAFRWRSMTEVHLPSSLKTIGSGAFRETTITNLDVSSCTSLERILPYAFGWTNIKSGIDFSNCTSLTDIANYSFESSTSSVILPRNLTLLGSLSFARFKGSVILSPVLESIGSEAFRWSNMIEIKLPSSLKIIKSNAFRETTIGSIDVSECTLLETLEGSAFSNANLKTGIDFTNCTSLKNIGGSSFEYSPSLVILPKNLVSLGSLSFASFKGSVILSPVLESIGSEAFRWSAIKEISLPKSLTYIGSSAFQECSKLEQITCSNPTPPALGTNVFFYVNKTTCKLNVPKGSIPLYAAAAQWKDFLMYEFSTTGSLIIKAFDSQTNTPLIGGKYRITGDGLLEDHILTSDSLKLEDLPYGNYTITELYPAGKYKPSSVKEQTISLTDNNCKTVIFNNTSVSKELDLSYTLNNVDHYPYHAVRIGEYYWIDQNFYHKSPRVNWTWIGVENEYPMSQARLDKYLPCARLNPSKYQVNIDDFDYLYGGYYHMTTAEHMDQHGSIIENGVKNTGWGLPTAEDFYQLFGMCPSDDEPYMNGYQVTRALGLQSGGNSLAFDIEPDVPGSGYQTYWFSFSNNIHKFNMMPAGAKLNADNDPWVNGIDGIHYGNKGDLYHLFYATGFWIKGNKNIYIHDFLDVQTSYNWYNIRFCRRLTDQELGYKLYKNDAIKDIIKLGLTETAPVGYTELEAGYLRGFYVQYILDNPNPTKTVADLYNKLNYINQFRPRTSTRGATAPALEASPVTIYPNPVTDILHLDSPQAITEVQIYSTNGKMVLSQTNVGTSVNVNHLASGAYVLKLQIGDKSYTHKMIKK